MPEHRTSSIERIEVSISDELLSILNKNNLCDRLMKSNIDSGDPDDNEVVYLKISTTQ